MTDEHIKGTISRARGKVEETVGKLTGDRHEEAQGKIRQIKGKAQQGLGDVKDAIRRERSKPRSR
jgi:uncharacterized protein YjbJ (UPF0337 family)